MAYSMSNQMSMSMLEIPHPEKKLLYNVIYHLICTLLGTEYYVIKSIKKLIHIRLFAGVINDKINIK